MINYTQNKSARIKFPFIAIIAFVISIYFFKAPIDTDLGWHLRYGNYFLENGKILRENSLTYFMTNYKWANSYALYQIITAFLFKTGGLFLLTLSFSLVMILSFVIFNLSYPKNLKINFLLFTTLLLISHNTFDLGYRAQIFSFLFVIIINFLIKRSKEKENIVYLSVIPFIFALWSNIHGAFPFGFIIAIYHLYDIILKKKNKQAIILATIMAISFFATLINPLGFEIYKEIARHFQNPLQKIIAEWTPPSLLIKLIIITSTAIIFTSSVRENKKSIFRSALLAILALSSLSSKRNVPFWAIFAVIEILENQKERTIKHETKKITQKIAFGTIILLLFLSVKNLPKNFYLIYDYKYYCNYGLLPYPCKAVEFIKRNKIKGENVFSSYEWGGFLEWKLPEYKFFVDGRMPAWDTPEKKSPYLIYLEIIQAQDGWEEKLNQYKKDWLLIPSNTFLDIHLVKNKNSNWKEIYRDEISSIFVKNDIIEKVPE